jgi:hypothetical protein
MRWDGLLALLGGALLVLSAGCNHWNGPKPMNPDVEQSCLEEGYDRETTEFADCVKELSETDQ